MWVILFVFGVIGVLQVFKEIFARSIDLTKKARKKYHEIGEKRQSKMSSEMEIVAKGEEKTNDTSLQPKGEEKTTDPIPDQKGGPDV